MSNDKGYKPSPKAYGFYKATASKFINSKGLNDEKDKSL
jgi:hypothetical protein